MKNTSNVTITDSINSLTKGKIFEELRYPGKVLERSEAAGVSQVNC